MWEWGHHLTSRKTGTHNIALFLVSNFFVEVHIRLTDNVTTNIIGFAKNELNENFKSLLNPNDPFLKAFLAKDSSSETKAA